MEAGGPLCQTVFHPKEEWVASIDKYISLIVDDQGSRSYRLFLEFDLHVPSYNMGNIGNLLWRKEPT